MLGRHESSGELRGLQKDVERGKFPSRRVPKVLLSGRGDKDNTDLSLSRGCWPTEHVVSMGKEGSIVVVFSFFFFLPILRNLWPMVQ